MKPHTREDSTPLRKLLVEQMKDILWAETHLLKALTKISNLAVDPDLIEAFSVHRAETQRQIERIRRAFELLDLKARSKKCEAMAGLLAEANGIAEEFKDSAALDSALICAAQKVEHYEIATYGCLIGFATALRSEELLDLFRQSLVEERNANRLLSKIAMASANRVASKRTPRK